MSKTNLVNVVCNKCGHSFKLDIGSRTKEEVIETLKNRTSFECPGKHVEIGSPLNYWKIDWDSLEQSEKISESDWLNQLKSDFRYVFSTEEFREKVSDVSFSFGLAMGRLKENNKELVFDFGNSPSGNRYYYAN